MATSALQESQLNEPLLASPSGNEAITSGAPMNSEDENAGETQEEDLQVPHDEIQAPSSDSRDVSPAPEAPWYKSPLQLVAMLSNYSTSYNVMKISMVLPILEKTIPGTTTEDAAASASSLLAGMIVGQLLGGYLGDSPVLGRLGALQLVMALQVIVPNEGQAVASGELGPGAGAEAVRGLS